MEQIPRDKLYTQLVVLLKQDVVLNVWLDIRNGRELCIQCKPQLLNVYNITKYLVLTTIYYTGYKQKIIKT